MVGATNLLLTYLKIYLRHILTLSLVISLASIGLTDIYSYMLGIRQVSESFDEEIGYHVLIVYPGSLVSSDIRAVIPNNPSIYKFIRDTHPLREDDLRFLNSLQGVKRVIPFGVVQAGAKFDNGMGGSFSIMYFDIENNVDIMESLFIFIEDSENISNRSMFLDFTSARRLNIGIGDTARIGYYGIKKGFLSIEDKLTVDGLIIFTAGPNIQVVVDSGYLDSFIKNYSNMTLYNMLIKDGYLFQYNGFILVVENEAVPSIVSNITNKYDEVLLWTSTNPRSILINITKDFVSSLFVTTSTYSIVLIVLVFSNIYLWRKSMNRILYLLFTLGVGRIELLRIISIVLLFISIFSLAFSYTFYLIKGWLYDQYVIANLFARYGRAGLLTGTIKSFIESLSIMYWNTDILIMISVVLSISFGFLVYVLFLRGLRHMFKGEVNV